MKRPRRFDQRAFPLRQFEHVSGVGAVNVGMATILGRGAPAGDGQGRPVKQRKLCEGHADWLMANHVHGSKERAQRSYRLLACPRGRLSLKSARTQHPLILTLSINS